ncbi:hypothetical protein P7228_07745 [Altererythrobacter arenosus]|uniref:Uncharacterized protein n=1 Tax=Altererythrobacter arenosus TaxID=3032592 RepID=A0ABY8FZX8_9SPHN|nr:hypothetical protein [Altererythrobacter sp. CAU 1644]WFL78946.1 hypothetical protein P7228_07745 [Altererythrobacter sp. CAU 1644]
MFKKLIIVVVLAFGGLWAAGYDPIEVKDEVLEVADGNAGELTGREAMRGD